MRRHMLTFLLASSSMLALGAAGFGGAAAADAGIMATLPPFTSAALSAQASGGVAGTLTLTGATSAIMATSISGGGTLVIAPGSSVSAAASDLVVTGTQTLPTGVSSYDNTLIGVGAAGTLTVAGSGTVLTNTGAVSVGVDADGTLVVTGGGAVSGASGSVGAAAGTSSSVALSGAGSSWKVGGELVVGSNGAAAVQVADGASLVSGNAVLGEITNTASGTVTVTGAGSSWTNSGALTIGSFGYGTLRVENGGLVTTGSVLLAALLSPGGVLAVDGAGSRLEVTGDLSVGTNGIASATAGGVITTSGNGYLGIGVSTQTGSMTVTGAGSRWDIAGNLTIGELGQGALTIADGGLVTTGGSATIGQSGSIGQVGVLGSGSLWTIGGTLSVGGAGDGTLIIANGARVTDQTASVGTFGAPGLVSVSGAGSRWDTSGTVTIDTDGTVNLSDGAAGTSQVTLVGYGIGIPVAKLTIAGSGTRWSATDSIVVGYGGYGSLSIADGAQLTSGTSIISYYQGTPGEVFVSGAGSRWDTTVLYVGFLGDALLSVGGGAAVTADDVVLGYQTTSASLPPSSGQLTIHGAGSSLTVTNEFYIGFGGMGELDVGSGATVTSGLTGIGISSGRSGFASVSGVGARWTINGGLYLGTGGTGALSISQGGAVSAQFLSIADGGNTGTVSVSGAGSTLTVATEIVMGGLSSSLTIADGGTVSASQVLIGQADGTANARLVIGADTGATPVAPGTLNAAAVTVVNGTGVIVLNHTASDYTFASTIAGRAQVEVDAGTTRLTGSNSYSGGTTIAGGTLIGTSASFGTGAVVDNGTLVLDQSGAGTFANTLSGSGLLVKTGSGTVTLAGNASAFTGTTTILSGTLIGTTASFGTGAIVDNGTLILDQSGAGTFANTLTGTGALVKTGTGTVTLAGDASAFAGTTTISGGTLSLAGRLGGTVAVTAGGTLAGNGTTGSLNVGTGGVVAPGNSVGTIAVAGNFTQASGSLYRAEVQGGRSDLITVSGTATLEPGAQISISSLGGLYTPGARLTVLTAAGGVTGSYTLVGDTSVSAFYGVAAVSDARGVLLEVTQDRAFVTAAVTGNQNAVARALDSLPTGNTLHDAVGSLTSFASARLAFDQLADDLYGTLQTTALTDSHFARDAVIARLRAPEGPGAWGQAYGSWGNFSGTAEAGGVERSIGGFFTGIDGAMDETYRLGIFAGYSQSQFTQSSRAASADADTAHAGVYGAGQWGPLALRAGAAYAYAALDTTRLVTVPNITGSLSGSLDQQTTQVFADLGYRLGTGALALEPFAGLAYVHVATGGIAERGGLAALSGNASGADATFTTLGLRLGGEALAGPMPLRFDASAGWRHAFGDTAADATLAFAGSTPFTVTGVPLAGDVLALDAGLSLAWTPAVTMAVSYAGQWGDGVADNGLTARLAVRF